MHAAKSFASRVGLGLAVLLASSVADVGRTVPRAQAADAPETTSAPDTAAAEALLAAGKTREALEAFRKLSETPAGATDARIQSGLGSVLLATGDPHGAIPALTAALKARGGLDDRILLAQALIAAARGNLESGPRTSAEVVPYIEDALAQVAAARAEAAASPAGAAAAEARLSALEGESRWWLGDAARAREALAKPGAASDSRLLDLLARACYAQGAFGPAAAAWKAAGNGRGAPAALAAGKDDAALEAYVDLVKATPNDVVLLDEAIAAALYLGKVAELDAVLAAVPASGDGAATLSRARGRLLERAGRPADAVVRYREALALRATDPDAKSDLARARLSGAPEDPAAVAEASALFLSVLHDRPIDEWARKGLDYLARRDGTLAPKEWPDRTRLDRCVALFRALAEAEPTDATGWAQLGNALRLAGDPKASVEAFDRAIACNPFDASLHNDRGIALLSGGDRVAALDAYEKAVEIDPSDTSPRQNGSRLRWLAGDDTQAVAHLAAALSAARASPGHPMLYRFLLDRVWRHEATGTPP